MEKLQVILHILSYLARADRKFIDEEEDIISNIISQYCDGQKESLVESYVFNHKVTKNDYLNEVPKLAYMDVNTAELLIKNAEELVKVDGKITVKEQELFDILRID